MGDIPFCVHFYHKFDLDRRKAKFHGKIKRVEKLIMISISCKTLCLLL